MRISIREQLGILVLLTSLIALAVVAIATWVTSHSFVVGISQAGLSLTASLYSEQLVSNLVLLQTSVQAITTRVLIQNSLQRYNNGNNTVENWVRAQSDLLTALTGGGTSQYVLQAQLVSKNGTGIAGPYSLINATGNGIPGDIQLPYNYTNGTPVIFGDPDLGYPANLYPIFDFTSTVYNSSFNVSTAFYNGVEVQLNETLILGPWQINETFALLSITLPVINNTSAIDVIGWLTVVIDAHLIFTVQDTLEGLGDTGVILIVGPVMDTNRFPSGIVYNSVQKDRKAIDAERVRFVLPPVRNPSRSTRHAAAAFGRGNYTFKLGDFPAVLSAVSVDNSALNNAGSTLSTTNEENNQVAVGFAFPNSGLVDWAVVVEQDYNEVNHPINYLRNILIACVFGTTGALLLLVFPIAHYSVRPIRRLREATKRSIDPYGDSSENGSVRMSTSENEGGNPSADERSPDEVARKEGFMSQASKWGRGRRKRKAEKEEQQRRQSFRIPGKVQDRKHFINDELTDLTSTFNEMSEELTNQYQRLEDRVRERTRELELSKKAAEAANESKTLFIANISHELKTPLNGILGMCAVCMQEEDKIKLKRSLGIIYKSGDLLLHLLTDLLTFSKNQIGQQLSLDEKEFRLADVSSQILSIFEKQAKEGAINLRVVFEGPHESLETAPGTPGISGYGPHGTGRVRDMYLWGDQHRILQVIINLVSNSLKFTPNGGVVNVHIRCVGEVEEEKAPSSRKGSSQSRQVSHRLSKPRSRLASGSGSDVSLPKSGPADVERSRNIDTALEINARDPKQGSSITVRERSTSPPPINARTLLFEFEVEDSGPGIPPAQQRKVFEPFVQGDLGLNKKYGGTGLGLSICSQLAGLMRGSISLKSEEGVGSKFTMQIPLKYTKERADSTTSEGLNLNSRRNSITISDEEDSSAQNVASSNLSPTAVAGTPTSQPRLVGLSQPFFTTTTPLDNRDEQLAAMEHVTAEATKRGARVRVLVAEDNKVNQEVVLRMLQLEDIYDVTVAKDGQEAFDLVKESMEQHKLFNLIFMDIQMPNLNGLQSTRLIREMGYSAPIVALTAFAEDSNVKACLDSGMDFFLPKPIRRPALKKVLKKFCTIYESPEEGDTVPLVANLKNVTENLNLPSPSPFSEDISPLS